MTAELRAQAIVGNYVIERELGRGGMGAVYLGVHQTLGKRAAIKVLLPQLSDRNDVIARFWAEAKAVTAIKHAGIVDVYDHGVTSDGRAFIIMEYLAGESLGARLKARGLLTIPTAVAFARQIAGALHAAHAVGVIHRDLKPDNVLLVPDAELPMGERAKLLDFGVAKLVASGDTATKTITGTVLGTPHYMSPEQCEGARAVDHRSDLYSLGCTLFQMVSGRLPFESQGVGGLIGMHLHVPPPKLRDRAPHASARLEEIVARLLAKHPDERFGSGEELAAALAEPEAIEVDPSVSAPLPQQPVAAGDATKASSIDEPSRRSSRDPLRPVSGDELAATLPAANLEPAANLGAANLGASAPARRPLRRGWIAAATGLVAIIGVVAYLASRGNDEPTRSDVRMPPPVAASSGTDVATAREGLAKAAFDKMMESSLAFDWIDVGKRHRLIVENTEAGSTLRTAADDQLELWEPQAISTIEQQVSDAVARGDCEVARIAAAQFADGWGADYAIGAVDEATRCKPSIIALHDANQHADVVQACDRQKPTEAETRYRCVISACAIKDKNRARFFLMKMERSKLDQAIAACKALGVDLIEALK